MQKELTLYPHEQLWRWLTKEHPFDIRYMYFISLIFIVHLPAFVITLWATDLYSIGIEAAPIASLLFHNIGTFPGMIVSQTIFLTILFYYPFSVRQNHTMTKNTTIFFSLIIVLVGLDSLSDILMWQQNPMGLPIFDFCKEIFTLGGLLPMGG